MANVQELLIKGRNIFDLIYPVGSIYETSNQDFNPSDNFGGIWERIKGKVLVGIDEDDEDFTSVGLTGGEKEHTLTVSEMPKHNHSFSYGTDTSSPGNSPTVISKGGFNSNLVLGYQGNSQPHNNMPPYETIYIYKRVS